MIREQQLKGEEQPKIEESPIPMIAPQLQNKKFEMIQISQATSSKLMNQNIQAEVVPGFQEFFALRSLQSIRDYESKLYEEFIVKKKTGYIKKFQNLTQDFKLSVICQALYCVNLINTVENNQKASYGIATYQTFLSTLERLQSMNQSKCRKCQGREATSRAQSKCKKAWAFFFPKLSFKEFLIGFIGIVLLIFQYNIFIDGWTGYKIGIFATGLVLLLYSTIAFLKYGYQKCCRKSRSKKLDKIIQKGQQETKNKKNQII